MTSRTIPSADRVQAGRARPHTRVAAAPHIIALEDVEKSFGEVRAVDGVSLVVEPREILALLGPNGAGKTTLLRLALGMIRPDRGRVSYGLGGVVTARPDRARIGYLPEERGLYQDVPVRRYLMYFAVLRCMRRPDARREADRWLGRLGLADRATDDLRDLSKGNQQKVQFMSSIIHRPALAVLDEPFSGLDPLNQDLFLSLIRELRDAGTTVVLSAHQMQLVERLADRVVLIRDGRTAEAGTIEQLRDRWGAGRKLTLRVQGRPDVAFVETLVGVRGVRWSGADELDVEIERDALISPLLEAIGRRLDVRDLKTDAVTLHDIYVRSVSGVDEPAEQVIA